MYEIVPGFGANCLTILLVNIAVGQKDIKILKQFEEVVTVITAEK
ncbi:MAG: hypothetical protein ACYSU3_22270 [Planctomycetota bacterium]|jgi:hypothetical protein